MSVSMFPHTVTIYNTSMGVDLGTIKDELHNYITVLRGVLLDASKAVNVRTSGLEGADAVNLYIPFNVEAVDGITGKKKQYIGPMDFWRMEDKSGHWTLSVDGHGGKTIFVKGEVVEPDLNEQKIRLAYDDAYSVTKIDEKDFGSLKHWEVGGV